jgi:hypothetical protein
MNLRTSNALNPQAQHLPVVRAVDVGYGYTKLVTGIVTLDVREDACPR